jgi:hypothetical protein
MVDCRLKADLLYFNYKYKLNKKKYAYKEDLSFLIWE